MNRKHNSRPMNLLLITRDPSHAISSHLAREHRRKGLMLKHRKVSRESVKRAVDTYMGLILLFKSFEGEKIHIKFSNLCDEAWRFKNLPSVISKIARDYPNQDIEMDDITQLAKDSQNSLQDELSSLKHEISKNVADFIDYKTVLEMLEQQASSGS